MMLPKYLGIECIDVIKQLLQSRQDYFFIKYPGSVETWISRSMHILRTVVYVSKSIISKLVNFMLIAHVC